MVIPRARQQTILRLKPQERHLAQQRAEALVEKSCRTLPAKSPKSRMRFIKRASKAIGAKTKYRTGQLGKPKSSKQILNEMREQLAANRKKRKLARRKIEKQ